MPVVEEAKDVADPAKRAKPSGLRQDLAILINCHVSFLRKLHGLGITIAPPTNNSIRRYVELWLPLLHKISANPEQKKRRVFPPPDIAWLWHCHRLSPLKYEAYIIKTFPGSSILKMDAIAAFQFLTKDLPKSSIEGTLVVWKQQYPTEPFFVDEPDTDSKANPPETVLRAVEKESGYVTLDDSQKNVKGMLDGFDLVACAQRQATFLWRISGPEFMVSNSAALDQDFLASAIDDYERFLLLKNKKPNHVLVPTYPIDLVWHTHILASINRYNEDCIGLVGEKFQHDDSLATDDLGTAFSQTCALWKDAYTSDLVVSTSSHHMDPPKDFYSRKWQGVDNLSAVTAVTTSVTVEDDAAQCPVGLCMALCTAVSILLLVAGIKTMELAYFVFAVMVACLVVSVYGAYYERGRGLPSRRCGGSGACGGGGGCGGGGCGGC